MYKLGVEEWLVSANSADCSCVLTCRVKFGVPLANTLVAGQLPEPLVVSSAVLYQ